MTKGTTLEKDSLIILALDGTLVYVEDVQPTYVAVVALPEQPASRSDSAVFTAGKVGPKKISPYSRADRTVERADLSEFNLKFLAEYASLRQQRGPNEVFLSEEQKAKMTVIKAGPAPRGKVTDPEQRAALKKDKREKRRAGKQICVKCGKAQIHADHQFNTCAFEAPVKAARAAREPKAVKGDGKYRIISTDLTKAQAASDKFADGNRFWRVFRALNGLPESTGTLAEIMAAVVLDGGRVMTNVEKVSRRALKGLADAGNVVRA